MKWWVFLQFLLLKISELIDIKVYAAAVALNAAINQSELDVGMLYPEITRIREVSVTVAREVIRQAQRQRLDREQSIRGMDDEALDAWIKARMYDPAAQTGFVEQEPASILAGGKSLL
jgi:malate dehydrogenase (oxaloacetate-decarboxylating)(NADP+)